MKGSSSLLLASSTLLSAANGLQLNKRHDPAVVTVNFEKKARHGSGSLARRADDVVGIDVDKHGTHFLYWANFTIGTPPQNLYAEVDTGSADLLVLTDEIEACKKKDCRGGIFSVSESRTFEWVDSEDEASGSFGSGESWSGYYANDTFTFGDVTLDGFQFVSTSAFNSTTSGIFSIFGVGLPRNQHAKNKYPSLPYALRNAGEINTAAYSLWLDDDQQGRFLFGGVNKAKYSDPLVTFPIPNSEPNLAEKLLVVLEGFGTTNDGNSTSIDFTPRSVLLDSGTVKSRLTQEMVLHILKALDGVIAESYGAVVPCDLGSKYTLDFTFGELTISVPLDNFSYRFKYDIGIDGVSYCRILYKPEATTIILGDDFLRGAYVVYDYENMEISLAQYKSDGGKDDIHEIIKSVPGASKTNNIPMEFEAYYGSEMGNPTSAPEGIKIATLTVISSGTGQPTETGGSKSEDDEYSAAVTSLPRSVTGAIALGCVAGAFLMW
ncbi:hypothetical protein FLONG3_3027 [Fusarium longipes]|uniref:Peptidase A1 domain-containing protein n=1 Tax=Fusarium longipes TaxID=694270 RepID=A0A395T293_9HYPO|nr:hypothetical protein FLONG3_3027 [Fusarium longipes]